MTKLTEQSNIADIAAVYNELKGTNTDVKTLAKRGKAKLLAQIDALLEAQAEKKADEQLDRVEEPAKTEEASKAKKKPAAKKAAKTEETEG